MYMFCHLQQPGFNALTYHLAEQTTPSGSPRPTLILALLTTCPPSLIYSLPVPLEIVPVWSSVFRGFLDQCCPTEI